MKVRATCVYVRAGKLIFPSGIHPGTSYVDLIFGKTYDTDRSYNTVTHPAGIITHAELLKRLRSVSKVIAAFEYIPYQYSS